MPVNLFNGTRDDRGRRGNLYVSSALMAALMFGAVAPAAMAESRPASVSIESQPLGKAIMQLSLQTNTTIYASAELVQGKTAPKIAGDLTATAALDRMLKGTGLKYRVEKDGTIAITGPRKTPVSETVTSGNHQTPKSEAAADDGVSIQQVTVTARRRQERIIDVPVAVSAFTQQQLADLKIEGGAELLRAIPNVNFSKDNFTGYNFSIRGIGTKVLSATADPGVAISFNNTALLRNRLFEQEYFDVQRLEVLRGPQGTLYGRNANAGVVNMLPNLPKLGQFSGEVQAEVGNYDSQRLRGYVNVPLGNTLAVRLAGAMTKRDGFDYNTVTDQSVNGRDLWSTRLGILWQPTEHFRANLLWEHFNEDDDRSRTGKQLCTRGETPDTIDYHNANGTAATADVWTSWTRSKLTPGCQAKSLFTDDAFGVADSTGSPMVSGLLMVNPFKAKGTYPDDYLTGEIIDPFNTGDGTQSKNLREIATNYDPVFRAKNDVAQLNLELDLRPGLTLYSQSLYMEDSYYGSQDFLRSQPASGLFRKVSGSTGLIPFFDMTRNPNGYAQRFGFSGQDSEFGAIFCDPQLGCSDHAQAVDVSSSKSRQWSQEFRLQSSFDGPFNFSAGANYLNFKTEENYYIFSNLFTIIAMQANNNAIGGKTTEYRDCGNETPGGFNWQQNCMYIDPNPLDKIDGKGHNYFRSISLDKTESWAVFGEGYLKLRDDLRLTAGLRYTDDKKTVTPVPTQLFGGSGLFSGNQQYVGEETISKGFVYLPDQVQSWGEFTGRLSLDWKPDLTFTDDTLIYASYAHGYKAGGGNPTGQVTDPNNPTFSPLPGTFAPEFLDAFEVGTKNALLNGRMTLNATGFYYNYKDYQISQILDRGVYTENVDAHVFGVEFEGAWRPTKNLRIDTTVGYLNTTIAAGEKSIDVMNRTAGNDDWIVVRPWATSPYTCIVPKDVIGRYIAVQNPKVANPTAGQARGDGFSANSLCPGGIFTGGNPFSAGNETKWGFTWDPVQDSRGGGRGFYTDLGGHHLPNAPEFTFNIGVQYRTPLPGGWDVVWRADYYRQSDSYARIYNTEYDKLQGWGNANLTVTMKRDGSPIEAQLYVKNVFDDTPITDAYTGPDELGNFANVFTLDPRIIGLSVKASF